MAAARKRPAPETVDTTLEDRFKQSLAEMEDQAQARGFYTLSDYFMLALNEIEEVAQKRGHSWTSVCKLAGVSRTSPDRWRSAIPETIAVITKLQLAAKELSDRTEQ